MSDPWGEKLERLDLTRRHYHNNDYLAFLVDSVWKLKASGRDFHIVSPLVMMDAALVRWGRPGRLRDALRTWQAITVDYAVLQIVAELRARGIYCALATNQNTYRARYMSEHLGYATTFDRAFYSCAIGFTKPDPRFFRTVLERLRLPPHHVLFIDDREENVAAARACGMEGAVFQPAATEDRSEVMRRVLAAHGLFDPQGHGAGSQAQRSPAHLHDSRHRVA